QTLVLYYRQNQSSEEVAAALEISEETVRQRLARGRQMLREQVTAMLERNLVRSAPRAQFASAVVAALPALVMPSAAAGAAGCAALVTMVLRWNRRHRALRLEEGLPEIPVMVMQVSPLGRFISLAAATLGSLAWMFALAIPAKDVWGASIVVGMGTMLTACAWW